MKTQIEQANFFRSLHVKGNPLILFNIWDAGGAQVIQEAGVNAIATSSFSVAASHGYDDGEKLPLDLALANIRRIVKEVELPVTIDFEGGYAKTPAKIQENVFGVIEAGAVGVNFEDQVVGENCLYSLKNQSERIAAIREVSDHKSIPLFINARTDIFFQANFSQSSADLLEEAIERAMAYVESGADGFFVPGLADINHIAKLCEELPMPVNVMIMPDSPPIKELKEVGVARISYGPGPFFQVMDVLKKAIACRD